MKIHPLTGRAIADIHPLEVVSLELEGDELVVTLRHGSGSHVQFKLTKSTAADLLEKLKAGDVATWIGKKRASWRGR